MELDEDWVLAGFEALEYQNANIDRLAVDLFVRCAVYIKAVKAVLGCGIIEWCHGRIVAGR